MNELKTAIKYIDSLTVLLSENEYKLFLYSHLISIKTELQRQLEVHANSTKTKE
jgi:sRNA-binding regulator protein Hfq